jgi:SAM-dependent methyltransferase
MVRQFIPHLYWEKRHHRNGGLRGVGRRTSSEDVNRLLYEKKWIEISETVSKYVPIGSRVLDAGCGVGVFTDKLFEAGYRMTGVDFSSTAIERARRWARGDFRQMALHALDLGKTFDAVICIDVLFHVVDDGTFQECLSGFARHMTPGGVLLIQETLLDKDADPENPVRPGPDASFGQRMLGKLFPHVHQRYFSSYRHCLEPLGLGLVEWTRYRLGGRHGHKDLLVFRKS